MVMDQFFYKLDQLTHTVLVFTLFFLAIVLLIAAARPIIKHLQRVEASKLHPGTTPEALYSAPIGWAVLSILHLIGKAMFFAWAAPAAEKQAACSFQHCKNLLATTSQ